MKLSAYMIGHVYAKVQNVSQAMLKYDRAVWKDRGGNFRVDIPLVAPDMDVQDTTL